MVEIVAHATTVSENDTVLKRHQDSSPASSASATTSHAHSQQQTTTPDAVAPPGMASDVRLEISQNKSINSFVYKLIDKKSGEVVRQWPTEQMVKMREYIAEQQIQLVDEKA